MLHNHVSKCTYPYIHFVGMSEKDMFVKRLLEVMNKGNQSHIFGQRKRGSCVVG